MWWNAASVCASIFPYLECKLKMLFSAFGGKKEAFHNLPCIPQSPESQDWLHCLCQSCQMKDLWPYFITVIFILLYHFKPRQKWWQNRVSSKGAAACQQRWLCCWAGFVLGVTMATRWEGNDGDFFVYLLNYFTCTSHPDHEGIHSMSFSHQELFRTAVGKIKITRPPVPSA